MRGFVNHLKTGLHLLRRGFTWWVESFAQLPGVTRDMDLPAATLRERDSAEVKQAARELADEMVYGASFRAKDSGGHLRVRM